MFSTSLPPAPQLPSSPPARPPTHLAVLSLQHLDPCSNHLQLLPGIQAQQLLDCRGHVVELLGARVDGARNLQVGTSGGTGIGFWGAAGAAWESARGDQRCLAQQIGRRMGERLPRLTRHVQGAGAAGSRTASGSSSPTHQGLGHGAAGLQAVELGERRQLLGIDVGNNGVDACPATAPALQK